MEVSNEHQTALRRWNRSWTKLLLFIFLVPALLGTAALVIIYLQSQSVPEFYLEAEVIPEPEVLRENADELEREVLDLSTKLRRDGEWQFKLQEDQINSWLMVDLVQKFPEAMPQEVSQPRVAIEEDRILAAARTNYSGLRSIVSVEAEPFATEIPHEVAVRLLAVRIGAIRVPMKRIIDQITTTALERNIALRWDEMEGDPVAIVDLRTVAQGDTPPWELRGIELSEGEVVVSGRTLPQDGQ